MIGISFHSGGLQDKPFPWVTQHLGSLGYDAVEIVCGPTAHIRTSEPLGPQLDRARELLAASGLRAAAINPYGVKPLPQYAQEADAYEFYCKLVDIAVALDAPTVNFLPGRFPDSCAGSWRKIVETVKPILHYAGEHGVNLTIHNHENMVLDTPDKTRLIIEQVGLPNLKSLCDITNYYILGSDVATAVERVAPWTIHCHLKGVIGKFPFNHFLVPGEPGDEFPFDEFAQALGRAGYTGCISVETFSFWREDKTRIAYEMIAGRLAALGLREPRPAAG
ncbi:MAG: sugar phosphate isomerase/epimerase [Armatimonadetes bacterium]|nr:sugar phosphate isomerase/epimerase [Armatimonadota bacterium]